MIAALQLLGIQQQITRDNNCSTSNIKDLEKMNQRKSMRTYQVFNKKLTSSNSIKTSATDIFHDNDFDDHFQMLLPILQEASS